MLTKSRATDNLRSELDCRNQAAGHRCQWRKSSSDEMIQPEFTRESVASPPKGMRCELTLNFCRGCHLSFPLPDSVYIQILFSVAGIPRSIFDSFPKILVRVVFVGFLLLATSQQSKQNSFAMRSRCVKKEEKGEIHPIALKLDVCDFVSCDWKTWYQSRAIPAGGQDL